MQKLAVVDVCDTLFLENTTFGFIDFVARKEKRITPALMKIRLIKISLLFLGKFLKTDIFRIIYIYSLKGISYSNLCSYSKEYYDSELKYKVIKETLDILNSIRITHKVVLCSASLDLIVSEVASRLGVDAFFSSELAFSDGVCAGYLKNDLLGKKNFLFNKIDWVITDNKSDLELIKMAEKHTIISKPKNIKFWNKHGYEVNIVT